MATRARVPGLDPGEFWDRPASVADWSAMADKYAALTELARLPDDPQRKPALRRAARRWPGSLREAELIGPVEVEARVQACARGREVDPRPRARWRELSDAAAAVLLWSELHELLGDQLRFRARAREQLDVAAFARWVAGQDARIQARWPAIARLPAHVPGALRVRTAYLWLAARTGLSLPALNELLLARTGHWDRRADDPSWAHDAPD